MADAGSAGSKPILRVLVTGGAVPVREAGPRPGGPAMLVADISRAGKMPGWRPAHSGLKASLSSAWAWRLAHPGGYGALAAAGSAAP